MSKFSKLVGAKMAKTPGQSWQAAARHVRSLAVVRTTPAETSSARFENEMRWSEGFLRDAAQIISTFYGGDVVRMKENVVYNMANAKRVLNNDHPFWEATSKKLVDGKVLREARQYFSQQVPAGQWLPEDWSKLARSGELHGELLAGLERMAAFLAAACTAYAEHPVLIWFHHAANMLNDLRTLVLLQGELGQPAIPLPILAAMSQPSVADDGSTRRAPWVPSTPDEARAAIERVMKTYPLLDVTGMPLGAALDGSAPCDPDARAALLLPESVEVFSTSCRWIADTPRVGRLSSANESHRVCDIASLAIGMRIPHGVFLAAALHLGVPLEIRVDPDNSAALLLALSTRQPRRRGAKSASPFTLN